MWRYRQRFVRVSSTAAVAGQETQVNLSFAAAGTKHGCLPWFAFFNHGIDHMIRDSGRACPGRHARILNG